MTGLNERRDAAWLIRHGVPVNAVVMYANAEGVRNRREPGNSPVELEFTFQGQRQYVKGYIEGRDPEQYIVTKSTLPIFVDPQDPGHWTGRQAPVPIMAALASAVAVLGAGLLVLVVGAFVRRPVLRTWRLGRTAGAVVLNKHQAALAPRSWALRCTLADGEDKRVFTVYVPGRVTCEPGQALWVIAPPVGAARGRPLAAAWFE